jgi:chemotaxis protein histidine kinase CheA
MRLTHAIKGDAALLELDFVGDKAEVMEDQVRALLAQEEVQGEDFLTLTLRYADLRTAVEELRAAVGRLQDFRHVLPGLPAQDDGPAGFLGQSLRGLAERLAARDEKRVEVRFSGLSLDSLPEAFRKPVKDCLVQLLRNAVRHGIESPDRRQAAGKPAQGALDLELRLEAGWYTAALRDDGAGIDLERVRSRALDLGLVTGEAALRMAPRHLVPFIFHPGFSTAEITDEVAGKGIGMSLVRQTVKGLGGRIGVQTNPGRGSEFRLTWPADPAALAPAARSQR